jgi:hypothetical protein
MGGRALGFIADSKQRVVSDDDVAWVCKYDYIVTSSMQALWPIESIQATAQLHLSHCNDGVHWVGSYSRICVVGGDFLALRRVDGWVIIWSLLGPFWDALRCFVDFIITLVIYIYERLC